LPCGPVVAKPKLLSWQYVSRAASVPTDQL
jgi:hypothetical protein